MRISLHGKTVVKTQKKALTQRLQKQSTDDSEPQQVTGDTDVELALEQAKEEEEDEDIAESDPMLFEAGKVLSEQIQLQTQTNSQRLALMKKTEETSL